MEPRKTFPQDRETLGGTLLFSLLFFLCAADQTFTTRLMGFNFRWGQFLLLGVVLSSFRDFKNPGQDSRAARGFLSSLALFWAPFFLVYLLAAALSPEIQLTLLKWGWGLFNFSLAALLCLNPRLKKFREPGFRFGILAVAAVVWCQALAIYWLGWPLHRSNTTIAASLPFPSLSLPFPLGFAQTAWDYGGLLIFRPHAYYYEPSFAGTALCLGFALLLFLEHRSPSLIPWIPAVTLGGIVLAGSRAGILGALLLLGGLTFLFTYRRKWAPVETILKTILLSGLFLFLFSLFPGGKTYLDFLYHPMGIQASLGRVGEKGVTETGRFNNAGRSLDQLMAHPVLGAGVPGRAKAGNLKTNVENIWLELGRESGLLGMAAFLGALLLTLRLAWGRSEDYVTRIFLLAAWGDLFVINYNLTQSFPRLDLWLLFFFSLSLLVQSPKEKP